MQSYSYGWRAFAHPNVEAGFLNSFNRPIESITASRLKFALGKWALPMNFGFPHSNSVIDSNQWSFLLPLIGGRYHIILQLAVYPLIYHLYVAYWVIIYITYHLLREPETAIDHRPKPLIFGFKLYQSLWKFTHAGLSDHFPRKSAGKALLNQNAQKMPENVKSQKCQLGIGSKYPKIRNLGGIFYGIPPSWHRVCCSRQL